RVGWIALVVALCAGPAAPAHAYLWQQHNVLVATPPYNVRVTAVYLPKTIRVEWAPPHPGSVIQRTAGGVTTTLGTTNGLSWDDVYNFSYDSTIQYSVATLGYDVGASMG